MVIFIQKIKTKEGINSLNLDKLKKEVPVDYELADHEPAITFTANHVVLSWMCKPMAAKKETAEKEGTPKKQAASKKTLAAKKEAVAAKETAKEKVAPKKKKATIVA